MPVHIASDNIAFKMIRLCDLRTSHLKTLFEVLHEHTHCNNLPWYGILSYNSLTRIFIDSKLSRWLVIDVNSVLGCYTL
jgi:hypothetical protein